MLGYSVRVPVAAPQTRFSCAQLSALMLARHRCCIPDSTKFEMVMSPARWRNWSIFVPIVSGNVAMMTYDTYLAILADLIPACRAHTAVTCVSAWRELRDGQKPPGLFATDWRPCWCVCIARTPRLRLQISFIHCLRELCEWARASVSIKWIVYYVVVCCPENVHKLHPCGYVRWCMCVCAAYFYGAREPYFPFDIHIFTLSICVVGTYINR